MAFQREPMARATFVYQNALFSLFGAHGRLAEADHVAAVGALLDMAGQSIAGGRRISLKIDELPGVQPENGLELARLRLAGETIEVTLRPIHYRHAGQFFEMLRRLPVMLAIAGHLAPDADLQCELHCELGDAAYLSSLGFSSYDRRTCLVPDPDFFLTGGHERFRQTCLEQLPGWDERGTRVFWRGTTTGSRRHEPPGEGEADAFTWLQRLMLCRLAAEPGLAELCDVGIVRIAQIGEPWLAARITGSGLMRAEVGREAFLAHRVVVDIDGNSNAWSGLFCSLLSRSCIIKVASERGFRQWYYDRLTPWQTYVPVSADLSDFAEAVAWTLIYQADTRRLADAAAELGASLTFEAAMQDAVLRVRRWLETRQPFSV